MVFNSLQDAISNQTAVGVPKRLMLAELLLLTTMFAVIFGFLVLLGASGPTTFVITSFIVIISFGQAILYEGRQPRQASIITGLVTAPVMFALLWFDECWLSLIGTRLHEWEISTFGRLGSMLIVLTIAGPVLGYLSGLFVASWFYACDSFRERVMRREPRASVGVQSALEAADLDGCNSTSKNRLAQFIRWLGKARHKTVLESALAALILTVIPLVVIAPFLPTSSHRPLLILLFFVVYCTAAWQLGIKWCVFAIALGVLATLPTVYEFHKLAYVKDTLGESASAAVLISIAGAFTAALLCSSIGWLQLLVQKINGAEHKEKGVWISRVASLVLIAFAAWLAYSTVRNYRRSPTQQLLTRIVEDEGLIWWAWGIPNSLSWRPRVEGVDLVGASGNHLGKFLRTFNGRVAQYIMISDADFRDEHLQAVEGHQIRCLSILKSSLTDNAFQGINDFGTQYLGLTNSKIGNQTLERLASFASLQTSLTQLNISNTATTKLHSLGKFQALNQLTCDNCHLELNSPITRIPTLNEANFDNCPVDDDQLRNIIAAFPNLEKLSISNTLITDDSIPTLCQLPKLFRLTIESTRLTQAGCLRLEDLLRDVDIVFGSD